MRNIHFEKVYEFHKAVLTKAGLDEDTCETVAFGLCETSLRGVDSHGIQLLPHYTRSALWVAKIRRQNKNLIKCSQFSGIWTQTTHLVTPPE